LFVVTSEVSTHMSGLAKWNTIDMLQRQTTKLLMSETTTVSSKVEQAFKIA